MMPIWSHLHRADHPVWRQEPDYDPEVSLRLAAAYVTIQEAPNRVASFREAGYQVIGLRDLPMCQQQHLNVSYLMGMAHAADDEYPQALSWLDQAVEIARSLGDRSALLDLLFLRGVVARRLNLLSHALDDYCVALNLHQTLRREHLPVDSEQELLMLVKAAGYALTQEEYDLTKRLLAAAGRAARHVSAAPTSVANYYWILAGYRDARGHLERALQPALRAVAAAAQDGCERFDAVRINVFAARLAADLAASHEAQSVGRLTHLDMAARALRAARRALLPTDRVGKGYIEIRQARVDALRGRTASALARSSAALRMARALDDGPFLVQALTVHGHILAERRDGWEEALRLYREARALATARVIPYAALQARRAMRRLEEQLPHEEP
jgi:tetratricopeptide (TPR) repeat protein